MIPPLLHGRLSGRARPLALRRGPLQLVRASLCAAVVATTLAATPQAAAVDPDCAPVVMLTARGSGEGLVDGHGPTMSRIVETVQDTKLKDGFAGSSIQARAIPYPAVGMNHYVSDDDSSDLFQSLAYGLVLGQAVVEDIGQDGCPDTKFILVGYSQGVLVARQLAEQLGKERVIGVVGVGDPAQKGDMPHISGGGRRGDGLFRWLVRDEDDKASTDAFYDAGVRYAMWCHPHDWICNFYDEKNRPPDAFNPLFQTFDHSYANDPIERSAIGATIAVMARDAVGSATEGSATPAAAGSEIDVVFAIDTTGSMDPYIDQAREAASGIADRLREQAEVVKVGVVEYRDAGDDFRARFALDLTTDQDAFQGALDSLVADGGGDDPESVYSGVMMALRADWSPGVVRSVVVLGDAPAKDPEPGTGYTHTSLLAAVKDLSTVPDLPPTLGMDATSLSTAGGTNLPGMAVAATVALTPVAAEDDPGVADVSMFALTSSSELNQQLTPLAEGSGGVVTKVSDGASDVSAALLDTMDLIAHPMHAALAPPVVAYAGVPFVLNAGNTAKPPNSRFTFDADGDGAFDTVGYGSAQVQRLTTPGRYTATVEVTDVAGRHATASADYVVLPRSALHSVPSSWWPQFRPYLIRAGVGLLVLLVTFGLGYLKGRRARHT